MAPTNSSGTTTSTAMIGSSSTEPAFSSASRMPIEAAILNERSDESTSWYLPSTRRTAMSTTGIAREPAALRRPPRSPGAPPGTNSIGTAPPFTAFSNVKPSPGLPGPTSSTTTP